MDIKKLKKTMHEHIKLHGVPAVVEDLEPDMDKYCNEVQHSEEYKREYNEFLDSVRGSNDA